MKPLSTGRRSMTMTWSFQSVYTVLFLWTCFGGGGGWFFWSGNDDSSMMVAWAQPQQTLVWSEEFDSGTLNTSIWEINVGTEGWGNGQLQDYSTDNVFVEDGKLILEARRQDEGFTSGRIYSKHVNVQYGRIEASMKLPNVEDGLWPALWMMGVSGYQQEPQVEWPAYGTIRILQSGSLRSREQGFTPQDRVGSSVFWEGNDGGVARDFNEVSVVDDVDVTTDFVKYTVDWTPFRIVTFIDNDDDGQIILDLDLMSCITSTSCSELQQPFVLVLNLAVGGTFTGITVPQDVTASLPARLEVDYIRVYDNGYTNVVNTNVDDDDDETTSPTIAPIDFSPAESETTEPTTSATDEPSVMPVVEPANLATESPTLEDATGEEAPATGTTTTDSSSFMPSFSSLSSEQEESMAPSSFAAVEESMQPSLSSLSLVVESATPTLEPTSTTTLAPSDSPSTSEPTVAPLQRLTAIASTMTLNNIQPLDSLLTLKWQQVTRQHLMTELPHVLTVDSDQIVQVDVTLKSQNPPFVARQRGRRQRQRQRQLVDSDNATEQDAPSSQHQRQQVQRVLQAQEITFDTLVEIKSAMDFANVNNDFVNQAFANDTQTEAYLGALRASDDSFANANDVSMTQGDSETTQIQDGNNAAAVDDGGIDTSGIPFIVGVSVAGAAVVALFGLFVYSRHVTKRQARATTRSLDANDDELARETYPFEACKEADEDSLYDFTLHVPKRPVARDGASTMTSESSVTIEYDDQVAFQKESMYARASALDGVPTGGGVSESYVRRPSAHFYRFTVEAPAGLLGMVLERSVEGTPSVYGIKSTSPLASQVRVGDLLVSVDGVDVSSMDCTAVSRLIASKKQNNFRQFVFIRPQSDDDDDDDE